MKRTNRLIAFLAAAACFITIGAGPDGRVLEAPQADGVKVPIIMYHNLSQNPSLLRSKWVISPQEFEEDLKYIRENGYEPVVMADLVGFVMYGDPLPDKPVVLSFDDGNSSVYRFAYPLLKEYGVKAVVSIIGKVTDEYSKETRDINFPNLTWNQINEMINEGVMEVQNHSYNLHHSIGAKRAKGESEAGYRDRLSKDLLSLQDRIYENTGIRPTTFVYPFGAISNESDQILKELGFMASLTCFERMNTIKEGDAHSLFGLGRVLRPHGITLAKVFGGLIEAG